MAAPDSSNGTPTFRRLTLADMPSGIGGGSSKWEASGNDIHRNIGRVGIGTITPQSNLEVAGTIRTDEICDRSGNNCKTISSGWDSGGGGSGTLTSITAGTGLTGGTITSTGTIAVDVGTSAGKIVQLDSNGALPQVSGANLTGITATSLSGNPVDALMPTTGDFLSFNGNEWSGKSVDISDISNLAVALSNKIDAANMPPSCYANQTLTYISPTGMWACTYIAITPQVFGTQPEGMVLAAPTLGNGTPQFRKIELADLPAGIGGPPQFEEIDGNLYRNSGRVGIGIHFEPEAHLDSYYNVPAPGTEIEGNMVAGRSQAVVRDSWNQTDSIIGHMGRILTQNNQSGQLDYLLGVLGAVSHKGTGTIVASAGLNVGFQNRSSGVVQNNVGISISAPENRANGEIQNYTGLYITEPVAATQSNFAIFSEGGLNFFGGDMEVMGTIRATTICDELGNNCKNISDGWGSSPISNQVLSDLNAVKKQNQELQKDNADLRKQLNELATQVKILAQGQTGKTQKVAKAQ